MKIPKDLSGGSSWRKEYNPKDIEEFKNSVNLFDINTISNNTIYLQCKNISQSKLREAGFKITRDSEKADFIVIEDIDYLTSEGYNTNLFLYSLNMSYFDDLLVIYNKNPNYKYVYDHDLYKFLYKYEGNLELYNNLNELLSSNNSDNTKIAMELMTNANWQGNEIYLKKLFADHWSIYGRHSMRSNQYRNSISFKGFLDTLDFNYNGVSFYNADSYRMECKNDEHHEFVFNLYKQEFEGELEKLMKLYKIKFTKIEYEIDKSVYEQQN